MRVNLKTIIPIYCNNYCQKPFVKKAKFSITFQKETVIRDSEGASEDETN